MSASFCPITILHRPLDETFIVDTLFKARDLDADIAKVAVMPKGYHDVLTLLSATLKARKKA